MPALLCAGPQAQWRWRVAKNGATLCWVTAHSGVCGGTHKIEKLSCKFAYFGCIQEMEDYTKIDLFYVNF